MRILWVVWLASTAAAAAELKGRVLYKDAPVSRAQVRVFPRHSNIEGCNRLPQQLFGECLCPERQAAFGARLIAGLASSQPLATAMTAADGTFTVAVSAPGPWTALIASADGAQAAQAPLKESGGDLVLSDSEPVRFRLAGLSTGAVAWLFDSDTHVPMAVTRGSNDEWSSGPTPPGMRYLVIAAPGAQVAMVVAYNGRPMHLMHSMPGRQPEVPTLTLAAPQTIIGTVVDEKGRPARAADVIADPGSCSVTTKTNAKGQFTIPAVASAPYLTLLLAKSTGKVSRDHGAGGQNVELRLRPSARLELSVVDKQGRPVEGATVRLGGQHVSDQELKSDAAGKVGEADLYEEDVQIHVGEPWILLGNRTVPVKGLTKRTVVVEKGVTLAGRVVDSKGVPVPHVSLSVFYGEASLAQVTDSMKDALREVGRSSDARGEFSFLVVPGEYEVVAKRQEPGESAVMGTAPGRVELKLPFTLKIEGSVVDPAGKPIAGANVRASRTDVPNYTYGAVSDAQGKFEVPVRGPGTFEVSVSRAVGGPEKKLIVELGSAGAKPVKVVLEAVAVLRGSVVDSAGKPIAKVLVEAVPTSLPQLMMLRMQGRANVDLAQVVPMAKMMNMVFTATTAADGSFELPWAQEALVFVELKGFGADPVTAVPTAAMKIVLQARSVARGRVLDFAGKPVGRFTLNAQQVSDPDGRFEVSLPGSGALPLRIDAKPAPIESRSVEVPSSVGVVELGDLKLRQGFAVGGRVFAAETGKPIKHPFIRATSKAGDVDGIAVQQDGTFTYQGVPEGLLDIVVSAEGYSATTVSARAGDREVAIKLHRFASLTVTVLRDGEPASGASVKALGPPKPEGKNERYASVGPEGNAKLDQLEAGEWTVQVVDGPSKKVKLAPDQKGTVDFALR